MHNPPFGVYIPSFLCFVCFYILTTGPTLKQQSVEAQFNWQLFKGWSHITPVSQSVFLNIFQQPSQQESSLLDLSLSGGAGGGVTQSQSLHAMPDPWAAPAQPPQTSVTPPPDPWAAPGAAAKPPQPTDPWAPQATQEEPPKSSDPWAGESAGAQGTNGSK